MKRLLIVLFGVLVFQGSVWALPSGGDLCKQNGDGGKARVLSPADTQQLNKGSAILLQWKDSSDWLGNKVTIELHSRKGKTEQVVKTWPLQINTGSALITRADLRGAKIKKASKKDIRYVFRLKNHAKAKRFIDSGCFTFTKSEKSQRQRRNLKEEIEGLESTLTQALADISDLTDRLDALEEGGGTVIGGVGDGEDSAWLTGGPNNECLHDADGLWASDSGMNATKCKGVKWNAANGIDVANNPVCWKSGVLWKTQVSPWVVGTATVQNEEAYDCRTKCAQGEDFGWCAQDDWWGLPSAQGVMCVWGDARNNQMQRIVESGAAWDGGRGFWGGLRRRATCMP